MLKQNPSVLDNGWENININEAGLDDNGTSIMTTMGEQVLAINAKEEIMLVRVEGSGYRGILAIAKDPARLNVENSSGVGQFGQLTGTIAQAHNGILALRQNRMRISREQFGAAELEKMSRRESERPDAAGNRVSSAADGVMRQPEETDSGYLSMEDSSFKFGIIRDTSIGKSNILTISELCEIAGVSVPAIMRGFPPSRSEPRGRHRMRRISSRFWRLTGFVVTPKACAASICGCCMPASDERKEDPAADEKIRSCLSDPPLNF